MVSIAGRWSLVAGCWLLALLTGLAHEMECVPSQRLSIDEARMAVYATTLHVIVMAMVMTVSALARTTQAWP